MIRINTRLTVGIACAFLAWSVYGGKAEASEPRVAPPAKNSAESAHFSAKPAMTKKGDHWSIAFSASGPADCEVAVLDSAGKVVRHLAGGVLGGAKPPPEPLKSGLAQDIAWDGKDDFAASAEKGPFQARVRLGTQVNLGAVLASDPLFVCYPLSMATDEKGNLYMLSTSANGGPEWGSFLTLSVFDRKGEYRRTILPMPGTLPKDKVNAFGVVDLGGGKWAPRHRCTAWPDFYRDEGIAGGHYFQMAGRVGKDGLIYLSNNGSMLRLNSDGSAAGSEPQPIAEVPGAKADQYKVTSYFYPAVSPNGSRVYLCGLGKGDQSNRDAAFPCGQILAWDGKQTKPFADVKLGDLWGKGAMIPRVNYTDLTGMDCDAAGDLLVCDPTSNKVRMFSPDGKEIGAFAVDSPMRVFCHRKTNEVYVLSVAVSYGIAGKTLRKFAPVKNGAKEMASMKLADTGEDACMALDDSAEPAVVWVGTRASTQNQASWKQAIIYRLEDKGGTFSETQHPISFTMDGVRERVAVHPETEVVTFKGQTAEFGAVDGLNGDKVELPFKKAIDMAVGQDGNWYFCISDSFAGAIFAYDKNFKPIAKKGTSDGRAGFVFGKMGAGFSTAGMAVDRNGRVFALEMGNIHVDSGYFVIVFGADGLSVEQPWAKDHPSFKIQGDEQNGSRTFNSALVSMLTVPDWHYGVQGAGLQIDTRGNVYVGAMVSPADHKNPAAYANDGAYDGGVGAVVKFPKDGGQFLVLDGEAPKGKTGTMTERRYWPKGKIFAENATVVYGGMGAMSGTVGHGCSCRKPQFSVDGFGRLALPNAVTFTVRIVDNAGNEIVELGKYGNVDAIAASLKVVQDALPSGDPLKKLELIATRPENLNAFLKSKPLPQSEISFGWPEAVAVSERSIYVADVYNHCVVRLDRAWANEAVCSAK